MTFYISEEHRCAIELAQKSAIRLRLHSDAACTACQYLHRVYRFFENIKTSTASQPDANKESTSAATKDNFHYDTGIVVSTCLYIGSFKIHLCYLSSLITFLLSLACKTNEQQIRLSDLISTVHRNLREQQPESTEIELAYDDQQLMAKDHKYWKLRDSVTQFEHFALRILEFNLTVDLPHKYLIFYLKALSDWLDNEAATEEFFLLSWSLLNDYFCNHPASVEWQANQVALACIELAITSVASDDVKSLLVDSSKTSTSGESSSSDKSRKLWYTNFDKSLKPTVINSVIDQILAVCTTTSSKTLPPQQIDNIQTTESTYLTTCDSIEAK